MSKNTVRKYIHSLKEKCLIETEPTTVTRKIDGKKRNGSLLYKILSVNEAKQKYYNYQFKMIDEIISY